MTAANGRVMVVAAHPDDPEFLAGGTVAVAYLPRVDKADEAIATTAPSSERGAWRRSSLSKTTRWFAR